METVLDRISINASDMHFFESEAQELYLIHHTRLFEWKESRKDLDAAKYFVARGWADNYSKQELRMIKRTLRPYKVA